jgi:penicillin-binding protein 1A
LSSNQTRLEHVLEPGNAYLLTRTLEQVIERGTGTAADIGRPAAGKTGTANDYGDAWFVGFTPQLVAAVWVGYPQGNVPMTSVHGIRVTGGSFPALIWRGFMARALAGRKVLDFRVPEGELVTVEIDPETGLLAAPWCPGREETMLRALAPTQTCPAPEPPVPAVTPVPSPSPTPTPSESPTPEASSSPRPSPSPSGDDQEKGGRRD